MATKLEKPVNRMIELSSSWFRSGRAILTIHPSGFLGFREAGRRSQYKLNLDEAARQAVVQSVNKIKARERQLRQEGKRRGAKKQAAREVLANITR